MSDFVSIADVREAERFAKAQRTAAAQYLCIDERKINSPKDQMLVHRFRAAAVERSEAFDAMLSDRDINRLFCDGVISFEQPGG